ncbi:MAG: hypothetical protein EBZ69_06295, partial [Alphaproteobacteria bacterium]|nr:hypothetical protein [Alphaproteobacteria bacterium]
QQRKILSQLRPRQQQRKILKLKERLMQQYGLKAYDATTLVADQAAADFFEAVAKGRDGKLAANWVTVELFGALNKLGREISHSPISATQLSELVGLIEDNTISGRIAKDVFEVMLETGQNPAAIVQEKGWQQMTDMGAIDAAIDAILAQHADKVAEYKSGKDKLFGFFVGQVMKATGGKANPAALNDLLKKKLS